MTRLAPPWVLATLLLPALVAPAAAQGGYKSAEYEDLGLAFPRPNDYETVALQPDEEFRVLAFIQEKRKARTREQEEAFEERGQPTLDIVWIDWAPDPQVDPNAAPAARGRTTTDPDAEPEGPPPPITNLERFVAQRMPAWKLGDLEKGPDNDGHEAHYGLLTPKDAKKTGARSCFVYSFKNDDHTVALIGACHADDLADQQRIWTYMAERLEFSEPSTAEYDKWMAYYERRPKFRDGPYRSKVRSEMVRGWEAEDLDNYIVVYHTKDQPLVRSICRNLESIREKYIELFPPAGPIDAVSTVRICRDQEEYLRYSGLPGTAGYWNWVTEELVLYDAVQNEKGKRPDDDDTFIILYHEAFHQYIYYSAGQLAPHSWFNEGYGDYFSGALVKGGKVKKIDVNPWRIHTIQEAIDGHQAVSWEDIIRFEQSQYYANPYLCYAQGWSMIFFLNESRDVQRHDRWNRILPIYFDTLKRENSAGLEALPEEQRKNMKAMFTVGKAAREKAVEAAFDGVDLAELDRAWARFIQEIKVKR